MGGAYQPITSSVEVQSVYSTASADWPINKGNFTTRRNLVLYPVYTPQSIQTSFCCSSRIIALALNNPQRLICH